MPKHVAVFVEISELLRRSGQRREGL